MLNIFSKYISKITIFMSLLFYFILLFSSERVCWFTHGQTSLYMLTKDETSL